MAFPLVIFLLLSFGFSGIRCLAAASCPLDFKFLEKLVYANTEPLKFLDIQSECRYMMQGLRFIRSQYLQTTGYFYPPENSAEACWGEYEKTVNLAIKDFDVRSSCGLKTSLITATCKNISTKWDFERLFPASVLSDITVSCNQSLEDDSSCQSCLSSLDRAQELWSSLQGTFNGNESDCSGYPYVYAAGVVNRFGPKDPGSYGCLFELNYPYTAKKKKKHGQVFWGIVTGCTNGLFATVAVLWVIWACHLRKKRKKNIESLAEAESGEVVHDKSFPIRFTIDEIRKATNNFSWGNIIGKGGYGNVFKGTLADGSEVALKRFKNCAAASDPVFVHEVEVIASIRHVNLVELRGYCMATMPLEGHQRIIACELIRNGSLHDHLFGPCSEQLLSWPARWKIAVGTARGLAYLHTGPKPAIIHRDIKASNILLDETFEPKLADFGLAKFNPEGQSHLSTQVAGTLGYVAPEYALYGQLTERSDVYSFGVVLLQLLSSKTAVISVTDGETILLADWAWAQVRDHRVLDVVDDRIPALAVPKVMEKYVLLAVLCSHPLLHARPSMDQVVTILETDSPVLIIPDRPPLLLSTINHTDKLSSSSSSRSPISSPSEWPLYVYTSSHPILDRMDQIRGNSEDHSL